MKKEPFIPRETRVETHPPPASPRGSDPGPRPFGCGGQSRAGAEAAGWSSGLPAPTPCSQRSLGPAGSGRHTPRHILGTARPARQGGSIPAARPAETPPHPVPGGRRGPRGPCRVAGHGDRGGWRRMRRMAARGSLTIIAAAARSRPRPTMHRARPEPSRGRGGPGAGSTFWQGGKRARTVGKCKGALFGSGRRGDSELPAPARA